MRFHYKVFISVWLASVSPFAFAQIDCDLSPVSSGSSASTVKSPVNKNRISKGKSIKRDAVSKISRSELIYHFGDVSVQSAKGVRQKMSDDTLTTTVIHNGDFIYTGAQSFAVIRAYDGSQMTVPSNSKIQLKSVSSAPIRIELLEGRVDNSVTPTVDKQGQQVKDGYGFLLASPSMNLGVRGTQFKVEHSEVNQQSFVSVTQGEVVIKRAGMCEKTVSLFKQDGAFVAASGIQTTRLLDIPNLQNIPALFRGQEAVIDFPAVDNATRYHVQAAHDPDFVYLVEENFNESPNLKLSKLDSGYYHVRVTAIDQRGIESAPATGRILFQYQ